MVDAGRQRPTAADLLRLRFLCLLCCQVVGGAGDVVGLIAIGLQSLSEALIKFTPVTLSHSAGQAHSRAHQTARFTLPLKCHFSYHNAFQEKSLSLNFFFSEPHKEVKNHVDLGSALIFFKYLVNHLYKLPAHVLFFKNGQTKNLIIYSTKFS